MSNWNREDGRGTIPDRWLHCPRKSIKLINNKFLAFKTPLSSEYDSQVPEENRFSIDMLLASLKSQRQKIGLWIDLTNTSRFYNKAEVEKNGIRYLKLQCRGHEETPSVDQTRTFVQVCKNFIAHNPLEIIGVHCTHGFNRTGFLIVSYLVETDEGSLDACLALFAQARPPGIYKGDYILELYQRLDDPNDAPGPPPRPAWCLEYDDSNGEERDDDQSGEGSDSLEPARKKRKKDHFNKNPVFMEGVPGVKPILDFQRASGIQRRVQEICHWKDSGFPGSQPVSMDLENIHLLNQKPYRVSWKADGTRYMMLIQGDGQVFFIDRDNSVFEVKTLTFLHVSDCNRRLLDTLLDGEMVIDEDKGKKYPRYLAYDVIMYDGKDVSKLPFHPNRYNIIEREIIGGRVRAMKEGRIIREQEPFSIRLKQFWDVTQANNLLGEKFARQLTHEPDGLIFQPSKEPYKTNQCPDVLKWKPLSLNSVDFKLKIVVESGEGILRRSIGHLYVGGLPVPFDKMKITKQMKELNNKIIECKCVNGQWVFMRERTDKSFPNSYNTAKAVCNSIANPVTKQYLLDYIVNHRFYDDTELMPPPPKNYR
ncbi:mRNA-capping enzyme isoform X3 [Phymastichus coffea]|uniref:mRNA-capping enzyme isoform X3 n=1 Tax=Phymastichus coffea TaxID=108790 RepID=UPI00273C50AF|nr:mRNA-capping enzyme isoform X3 [Phymastichus coffea]XP_058795671.1 mRNA-capping enzyme isoform X3 [Phymastichus coffea]XP_058795672.1 mRNA-capping enzyme isoform X3 [Phymastichus coffea]XP_058795673.1 mRNA-capping enzyme isoform X3 [Phymastichus coffea]